MTLVATFILLGWLGADGNSPHAQQSQFGMHTASRNAGAAGDLAIGARYVADRLLVLHSRPAVGAPVVRQVVEGTPLLVVGRAEGDFAPVRDPEGQRGYVRLSDAVPDTATVQEN